MSDNQWFTVMLKTARKYDASDIHLIAGIPPTFRVGGEIVIAPNREPITREDLAELARNLLSDAQQERLEKERELSVSHYHETTGRIRLSLYHRLGVPEMAIRMCNQTIKAREELRLPPVVDDLAFKSAGLVIITGPTGAGKTTTLNHLIDLINVSRRAKIITIEDPVEFEHRHAKSIVTQIEVGTDTLSFSNCLRHVLRLDPDVIAIGEMRDMDTMETALTAAETGHLVLATLHTPSAPGAIERIVSSFDGHRQPQIIQQLASTLLAVLAQRLIPTLDKKGRVPATEVLLATDAIRSLIRKKKNQQIYNTLTTSRSAGMHTLESTLAALYQEGEITLEQAYVHANNMDSLKTLVNR